MMKNKIVLLLVIVFFGKISAMDNPLLHQPLPEGVASCLRPWLLSLVGTSILDCHESPVCHVAVTTDGRTAVTASEDHKIRIWDVQRGICQYALSGHRGSIRDMKIVPAQNRVLTISEDHTARLWNLTHGVCEHVLSGHAGPILGARLTSDGKSIITWSDDHAARIWDTASGRCTCMINCAPEFLRDAQLTTDGTTLITLSDETSWTAAVPINVRVWDARTGAFRLRFSIPNVYVLGTITMVISPDGKTIATLLVSKGRKNYQYCQLWDIATGAMKAILSTDVYSWTEGCESTTEYHGDFAKAMAFESENSVILYYAKHACIIDLKTNTRREISFDPETARQQDHHLCVPELSCDNHTAVYVTNNCALVWNLPECTLRHVLPNPFLTVTLPKNSCSRVPNKGFFSRIWQWSVSLFCKSHDTLALDTKGNFMASVTTDGRNVQIWNIGKRAYADVPGQLSFFQIALLSEIKHRLQTDGKRLILKPGMAHYRAYKALAPVIKNAIRPCIGIYLSKLLRDLLLSK